MIPRGRQLAEDAVANNDSSLHEVRSEKPKNMDAWNSN